MGVAIRRAEVEAFVVVGTVVDLVIVPGEGHGNPLQYSYLENPMDRGA